MDLYSGEFTMSFVTTVRDYVDFINQNYDSMWSHGNLLENFLVIFSHTLVYLFESIKYGLFYLFTFRWLTDLLYLPSWTPHLSKALLRENFYPLQSPLVNSFTLLEAPPLLHNKFFVGFLNSFFVSLPTSALHLLAARRLLVEGIPAGVAAGMGTIVGQSCFLASILFGWRWILIPWLSFEPLNYLVGILVLFQTIYTICHRPSIKIVSLSERSTLLTFFFLNLFLTWCEQSSLFQYIGNLTLTSDPSYVEHFFASSRLSSLGTHVFYLIGFVLGSCCFSLLFALMGLKLKDWWLRWSTMTTSRLVNRLNFFFLVGVTALSLASIPYYGIDYLFTKGLGFIPEDKTLKETGFGPAAGMADISRYLGIASRYKYLDTDVTPFDQGLYMAPPFPRSFEDLNYQGEQYWTAKMDRKVLSASTAGQKGKQFASKWGRLFGEAIKKEVPLDEKILLKQSSRAIIKDGEQESPSISAVQKSKNESFLEEPVLWYREFEKISVDPSLTPSWSDTEQITASLDDEDWNEEEQITASISDFEKTESDQEELERVREPLPLETEQDSQTQEDQISQEERLFRQFFTLLRPGFSPFFRQDIPEPTNLEKFLKNKFYENPLYHLLLRVDVDTFLARQPSSHGLSGTDEVDLARRRQLLADYYDSLQDYLELQESERSSEIDMGVASYANQVYNHQFKGTLKVVRRLFSITLDPEKNTNEERVLKFDQPLFHSVEAEQHPLVHEEENQFARSETNQSPLIEMTNPRPFYAGWDEQLRRLVITTRYLPRNFATHGMRIPDTEVSRRFFKEYFPLAQRLDLLSHERKDAVRSEARASLRVGEEKKKDSALFDEVVASRERNSFFRSTKKILFTAWPLSTKRAESASTSSKTFASTNEGKVVERRNLFIHPSGEYHDWEIEWWPENLGTPVPDRSIIPPNRGGFVWPGSSEFPFDVKKLIPDIKKFFQ